MKKLAGNVIKGYITSIIGVSCMVITLFLVFTGTMDFVWNGVAGLVIGCILLIAPKTLERKFVEVVGSIVGKNANPPSEEGEVK